MIMLRALEILNMLFFARSQKIGTLISAEPDNDPATHACSHLFCHLLKSKGQALLDMTLQSLSEAAYEPWVMRSPWL